MTLRLARQPIMRPRNGGSTDRLSANGTGPKVLTPKFASKKWRISAVRPDGGVVTQRTANPRSPGQNPQKLAVFTVRSGHCISMACGTTANFALGMPGA